MFLHVSSIDVFSRSLLLLTLKMCCCVFMSLEHGFWRAKDESEQLGAKLCDSFFSVSIPGFHKKVKCSLFKGPDNLIPGTVKERGLKPGNLVHEAGAVDEGFDK